MKKLASFIKAGNKENQGNLQANPNIIDFMNFLSANNLFSWCLKLGGGINAATIALFWIWTSSFP